MNYDAIRDEQIRMRIFIDILMEEDSLTDIAFVRRLLEKYNRKSGNHCARQLDELDERIKIKRKNMNEDFLKRLLESGNFTLNQPQINLGGVNTQSNCYHDHEAVRHDDAEPKEAENETDTDANGEILQVLYSEEGCKVTQGLVRCHLLDEDLQPMGLSGTEMAVVASELSKKLNIKYQWKTFGLLWNVSSATLRRSFYKAQEQHKTLDFYSRIKAALK